MVDHLPVHFPSTIIDLPFLKRVDLRAFFPHHTELDLTHRSQLPALFGQIPRFWPPRFVPVQASIRRVVSLLSGPDPDPGTLAITPSSSAVFGCLCLTFSVAFARSLPSSSALNLPPSR